MEEIRLPAALMEKMHDAGRYMLLCSAGELPPNLQGKWPGVFWTAGCGWLASLFSEYADYTGDRFFLEQRCLPLLRECARFHEDFLAGTEQDGRVTFLPSYNPETRSGHKTTAAPRSRGGRGLPASRRTCTI